METSDIYQIDYSIHSKLRIFSLFWNPAWKYNIQANERLTKYKEQWSTSVKPVQTTTYIKTTTCLRMTNVSPIILTLLLLHNAKFA